jgi:HAD superfamily hydrolase (TIGR01549 family)
VKICRIDASKTKVVIFDLWQTLADAREKPSDLFNLYIRGLRVCSEENFFQLLRRSDVFLKDAPIEVTLAQFLKGLGITDDEIIANSVAYWKAMVLGSYIFRDAGKLLHSLRECGFELCLLTNSDKFGYEHARIETRLGLFDYKVLSYQMGYAKPDKRCWQNIRRHFRVSYSEMLMIGDSTLSDIKPAKRLGIETIQLSAGRREISILAEMLSV